MADETGVGSTGSDAAGSSPASPAASATPADSASASAIVTPAGGTPVAQDPSHSGEPPKERLADILANARTKTESEVKARIEQEYRQKYGWADDFQNDPMSFLDQRLASHERYGPQLTQWAARHLSARRGAQQSHGQQAPAPDIPVLDQAGNIVSYARSDKNQAEWDEWKWASRQAEWQQRIAPLEKMNERLQQAQERAELQARADDNAHRVLSERSQNPFFKQHQAAIAAEFASNEAYGDNIDAAAFTVLTRDVLPKLAQSEQQKVLDSLSTKAAGATVNPGGATPSQTPKFKSHGEALRYYAEHPEEAAAMADR